MKHFVTVSDSPSSISQISSIVSSSMKKGRTTGADAPAPQADPDAEADMAVNGEGEDEELHHKRELDTPPAQQGYR